MLSHQTLLKRQAALMANGWSINLKCTRTYVRFATPPTFVKGYSWEARRFNLLKHSEGIGFKDPISAIADLVKKLEV